MSTSKNNDDDGSSPSSSPSQQQQHEDSIVYTTADGFEIPAEFETSCLMALEVERLIALENAKKEAKAAAAKKKESKQDQNDDDDDGESSTSSPTSRQISSPDDVLVVADFSTLFQDHDQDCKRQEEQEKNYLNALKEEQDQEEKEKKQQEAEENEKKEKEQQQETSTSSNEKSNQQHQNDEEYYYDEDEEDYYDTMEGMIHSTSALGMERDETDESQWKLEEILHRKSVAVHYDDIDAEVEDDDPRAVGHSATSKKKAQKEFSYLCKWAPGGRCTTWELRSLLIEEGFGPQVEAYDLYVKQKGIHEKKERVDPYKDPCEYGKIASREPKVKKVKQEDYVDGVPPHQQFFERLLPEWDKDLEKMFKKDNLVITRVCRVAPHSAASSFISHLKSSYGGRSCELNNLQSQIKITFHGTSPAGIVGIIKNGLVIPGHLGVSVQHGSAYGVKIYSGAIPSISTGYDRTNLRLMFGCVGIPTQQHTHGNFICFAEERKVCPVWLIQYGYQAATYAGNTWAYASPAEAAKAKEAAARSAESAKRQYAFEVCNTVQEFFKKVNFDEQSAKPGGNGISNQQIVNGTAVAPIAGQKMTTHQKKLMRQKRQQLGLERISI